MRVLGLTCAFHTLTRQEGRQSQPAQVVSPLEVLDTLVHPMAGGQTAYETMGGGKACQG